MRSGISAIGLLFLSISAAHAGGATFLHAPMPLLGTPVAPQGYTPAPVPNQDVALPRARPPRPGEPEFSASLTTRTPGMRSGQGYTPGSAFSEELQRKRSGGLTDGLAPTLGFSVAVDNR